MMGAPAHSDKRRWDRHEAIVPSTTFEEWFAAEHRQADGSPEYREWIERRARELAG